MIWRNFKEETSLFYLVCITSRKFVKFVKLVKLQRIGRSCKRYLYRVQVSVAYTLIPVFFCLVKNFPTSRFPKRWSVISSDESRYIVGGTKRCSSSQKIIAFDEERSTVATLSMVF